MCGDSRTQRWEFPVKNIRYYSVHAVAVLYICVLMCRILFFQKTGRGCVARVQVMALQHRAAPQTSCNYARNAAVKWRHVIGCCCQSNGDITGDVPRRSRLSPRSSEEVQQLEPSVS